MMANQEVKLHISVSQVANITKNDQLIFYYRECVSTN